MQTFIKEAQKEAGKVLKEGPDKVKAYQALLKELYPPSLSVSAVSSQYSDPTLITKNALLEASMSKTLDALNDMTAALVVLEEYVTLNIPQMEDGNNFGVTVQLSAQQHLTQIQDDLVKDMEELLKYKATRADALEKCKLPSKATTVSTTMSESESKGKTTKEGDQESRDNKSSKESKTTETGQTESPDVVLRAEAVQAVDVMYYGRAKAALRYGLIGFMNVLNFFDLSKYNAFALTTTAAISEIIS